MAAEIKIPRAPAVKTRLPGSFTEQAKRHVPVAFEVVAEVGSIHGPQRGGERQEQAY